MTHSDTFVQQDGQASAPVVYFSRFFPVFDGGGGSRRTVQIWEDLQPLGCRLISTARGDGVTPTQLKRIKTGTNGWLPQLNILRREYPLWFGKHRRRACRLRLFARHWLQAWSQFVGIRCALIDDPIYFGVFARELQRRQIPVVAVCHNFETLDVEQPDFQKHLRLWQHELATLAACDAVITISHEDTIVLNNLRSQAFFWPYYPITSIQQRLLAIREQRKRTPKRHLLLIGSAANMATRKGMQTIIEYWKTQSSEQPAEKLLVAGYETHRLLEQHGSDQWIDYLGELPTEAYDQLLCSIRGVICYQERGSGALTRIPEMLIAGVPVLANSHAARSYYNLPGVIEFARLEMLSEVIQQIQEAEFPIPVPEPPDLASLHRFFNSQIMQNR